MKDVAQDVAEDVFGAAKDGSAKVFIVKVLILPIVTCQLRTHAQHARAHASCRFLLHARAHAQCHLPAAETTPRLPLGDT